MAEKIQIAIAKPCKENWQQMQPTQQDRYCAACEKVVVDFTSFTEKQLLDYFKHYEGQTCGRLRTDQLRLYKLNSPSSFIKFSGVKAALAAAIALFVPVTIASGKAHLSHFTPLHFDQTNKNLADHYTSQSDSLITIKGKVVESESKEPLPGVSITVKETDKGVLTNADGTFSLSYTSSSDMIILQTRYIGYENHEIKVLLNGNKTILLNDLFIKPDSNVLIGEVLIVHSNPASRLWWRIKNLFH
ncbi:carboxypeptidase-like regulatory domain-containing protein [Pontibacter sp. SGAir0037]|uniref:carboxypeptidase-like regulatory domain-containing protein n=1 Tax=Pontibacter sp. SGAir0037 TaxID=2571030 RepID=UPI0010CD5942|nr:carboxypeptidase-like regulatory domain-containing protein [Pontibacter sp. SGAir0037]QCR21956.1 hypothetical protein C1N53_06145 [Pontibacter sp. SGAir0037]